MDGIWRLGKSGGQNIKVIQLTKPLRTDCVLSQPPLNSFIPALELCMDGMLLRYQSRKSASFSTKACDVKCKVRERHVFHRV